MFVDIACNITHMKDCVPEIFEKCKKAGVMPLLVGLDEQSSVECLRLAEEYNTCCYQGIHPNHIPTMNSNITSTANSNIISRANIDLQTIFKYENERVVGIGECGLDYFRSKNREDQKKVFLSHLYTASKLSTQAPVFFFHCRGSEAFTDFFDLVDSISTTISLKGVVHSFDGTMDEARQILTRGFYIGINGCSLKTQENIEVVRNIPLDRILLETDSPYCQVRKSHASSLFTLADTSKFNLPVNVKKIAEAVSKIKNIPIDTVETVVFQNTIKLFPKIEKFSDDWRSKLSQ